MGIEQRNPGLYVENQAPTFPSLLEQATELPYFANRPDLLEILSAIIERQMLIDSRDGQHWPSDVRERHLRQITEDLAALLIKSHALIEDIVIPEEPHDWTNFQDQLDGS